MTRFYCDGCGEQIDRNYVSRRFQTKATGETADSIQIEIHVCINGSWNSGHLCRTCLLEVVNNGEEV